MMKIAKERKRMGKVLLEVCCGSADDVIQAHRAGADRVELNSDLFHGGLTPTLGSLLVAKRETDMPIMAMVRPRAGGFCYTEMEFAAAVEDAKLRLAHGADGIVFGFLHGDGTMDLERTRTLADLARAAGKEAVFHRAIDVVPDWRAAIDALAEIAVTRILTSGQEPDLSQGTDHVREMIQYAAGRVQILPGAGITRRNMERVIAETGCTQIHLAAHRPQYDTSVRNNRAIYYGGCLYPPEDRYDLIDSDYIGGMVQRLEQGD